MTKENIPEYSVTELSTALKSTIEDNFGYVRIKGELSGINNHSSGRIFILATLLLQMIPLITAFSSFKVR